MPCVFCVSEGRRLAQIWFDCGEGSSLCIPEGASGRTSANFLWLSAGLWRFPVGGPFNRTHHHPHHPEKPTRLPPSSHQQLQELSEWPQMRPCKFSPPESRICNIWCIKSSKFKAGIFFFFFCFFCVLVLRQVCGRVNGIILQPFSGVHFSSVCPVEFPYAY